MKKSNCHNLWSISGYYKDYHTQYAPYLQNNNYYLLQMANSFITKDMDIWRQAPHPYNKEFVRDYTNKHVPEDIMNGPFNWFLDYKSWIENNKTIE